MNKFKPLLALLLFFPFILSAQTRIITGPVTDDREAPASNVTIQVKGGWANIDSRSKKDTIIVTRDIPVN